VQIFISTFYVDSYTLKIKYTKSGDFYLFPSILRVETFQKSIHFNFFLKELLFGEISQVKNRLATPPMHHHWMPLLI
jgi:hypothetical protein